MKRLRMTNGPLDAVDNMLLKALSEDARQSIAELSRNVGMSAPSVAERLKRLEEDGVITGYSVMVNPVALGLSLTAWLRIRPVPGELQTVAKLIKSLDDIVECDRITGEDCYIAKAHVRSVQDLEILIDSLNPYAMTNTSIVQSSPVKSRLPPLNGL